MIILRYRTLDSPTCSSTQCDHNRCGQDLRCSLDMNSNPGSISCMIRRDAVEERCFLGKDCPGASCPYAVAADRAPPGTMYIAVPAIRHHMPRTIVYRKGSPTLVGSSYRDDTYISRKHMVNACTQTTSDLLQDFVIIKKEPRDDCYNECACKCGDSSGSNVLVYRDGKTSSVGV